MDINDTFLSRGCKNIFAVEFPTTQETIKVKKSEILTFQSNSIWKPYRQHKIGTYFGFQ